MVSAKGKVLVTCHLKTILDMTNPNTNWHEPNKADAAPSQALQGPLRPYRVVPFYTDYILLGECFFLPESK